MYKKFQHIHFVGIGGIGMSGIAEVLVNLGYEVSGSDLQQSDITRRLDGLGATTFCGHRAENIAGADVVVISSAIRADNPEVLAARESYLPVIPRAEMLAELMRLKKYGIAVAGSHGKTTTTSMAAWLLSEAGMDPTVIIGGRVNSLGTNAKLGEGEFLVAEADESDGSFLLLSPVLEIVTNIDLEHVDHYPDIDAVKKAFLEFIHKIPFYGATILCLDDANIADLLPQIRKRCITYGLNAQAEVHAQAIRTAGITTIFEVWREKVLLGEVTLGFPGRHNIANGLAVVALGLELDIPFPVIARALGNFSGVHRRLEVKGEVKGILVIDDYGHHPTEIRATLEALASAWPKRRSVVLFQPHRYSRTRGLFKEFCTAFHQADMLVLAEIYGAGEVPIADVSGDKLLAAIREHGHRNASFIADLDAMVQVADTLREGDILLTLGAGNIWQVGEKILERLAGN